MKLAAAITLLTMILVGCAAADAPPSFGPVIPKQAVAPPQTSSRAGFFQVLDENIGEKYWSLPAPDDAPNMLQMSLVPIVSQADIASAMQGFNQLGMPTVDVTLTPSGRANLARFSAANIGEKLAIVIDGRVLSTPMIASAIDGGQLQITGNFTVEEATRLAVSLRGSAPAQR